MRPILLLIIATFPIIINAQNEAKKQSIDTVKLKRYYEKINSVRLFSIDRQKYLDSILFETPTNAYLWQQKAMPLFKQKKYELGLQYLDSAIKYDKTDHYIEYGAFIKCIFVRSYQNSIQDFENLKSKHKIGFVMDHSYDFYLGLCHLQLNQFEKAKEYFSNSILYSEEKWGFGHFLEYFYLGVTNMELGKLDQAMKDFDKTLTLYPEFPDVKFYKALFLEKDKKYQEATDIINKAKVDFSKGYSINEGNSINEEYPYQIKEYWLKTELEIIEELKKK